MHLQLQTAAGSAKTLLHRWKLHLAVSKVSACVYMCLTVWVVKKRLCLAAAVVLGWRVCAVAYAAA
jgi:hypothetical protein